MFIPGILFLEQEDLKHAVGHFKIETSDEKKDKEVIRKGKRVGSLWAEKNQTENR
jgi:hypothetical protein